MTAGAVHLLSRAGLLPVLSQGEPGGEAGSGLGARAEALPVVLLCGEHICWKVVKEARVEPPSHMHLCSGWRKRSRVNSCPVGASMLWPQACEWGQLSYL